jgi:UDP-2-acetamido-3-amino-2,3-dideoxy-glucuronate N-acetyltransferase
MTEYIAKSARIGDGCVLGKNIVIEEDVTVGANAVIGNNVVIMRGVQIGDDVSIGHNAVIHENTIIGSEVSISDSSIIGRQPKSAAISTRKVERTLPPLQIGDRCTIGALATLYAGTKIGVGAMVADMASIREMCVVKDYAIIGRGVLMEYETVVGEYSKIQTGCHITGNMVIEDHVFFGAEVTTMNDKYMDRTDESFAGPYIKSGARVGCNATLLPGVVIGKEAVIGAGAVVTKDVPDYKVAVGVPAQVIKDVPVDQLLTRG